MLPVSEQRTLEAVCDTIAPSLRPQPGDDPRLFEADARSVGVPRAIEEALEIIDPVARAQFRLLLRALEQPATMAFLIGVAKPFSRMGHSQREKALKTMATSPVPQLRASFQGFKRLVAFLFYSLPGSEVDNPTWAAIGYAPTRNQTPHAPILRLTRVTRPTTLECDVCVVGSGAGGGVVAAIVAAAGKRVVVLEAGSGLQAPDFDQHELAGMQSLYLNAGLTATSDLGVAILAGAGLGGGTAVNWQTSLPLPGDVREEWEALSGCRHFVGSDFSRSIDEVMGRLHVGTGESRINPNNDALRRGCDALGYRWTLIARNAHNCDLRQCGSCVFGCRHGGKQSTTVTYLCDAQTMGDTTIVPDCWADKVVVRQGRVIGVQATATDPATGETHPVRVRAKQVALAAGGIGTPLVLLRSGVDLPGIGRNLFLHPTSAVAAVYADPVETWSGPPQTVMSDHFARLSGLYGFRLETAPAHPGLLALAAPWYSARDHRRRMQQAGHTSAIIVLTRDRHGGRVRVGRMGQAVIEYAPGAQELAHLRRGVVEAARVHIAAGALGVQALHTAPHSIEGEAIRSPRAVEEFCRRLGNARLDSNRSTLFSAHQMGTCAMGTDRRKAVCGPDGQVFGVRGLYIADASAFPASSGVNPMVTVMALAHYTAQRMLT